MPHTIISRLFLAITLVFAIAACSETIPAATSQMNERRTVPQSEWFSLPRYDISTSVKVASGSSRPHLKPIAPKTVTFKDLTPASEVTSAPRPKLRPFQGLPIRFAKAGFTGKAVVGLVIDASGHVQHPVVLSADDSIFADAAIATVQRWTFVPAMRDGSPVRVGAFVTVTYAND